MRSRSLGHRDAGWFGACALAFAAAGVLAFVCQAEAMTSARAHAGEESVIELTSSVMWQATSKYIYPPGIPAILTKDSVDRSYRIEQYYSEKVSSKSIRTYVRGPWLDSRLYAEGASDLASEYVDLSLPHCDAEPTRNDEGRFLGYRCYSDLTIRPEVPVGAMGIAMAFAAQGAESIHPNSVFWIVFPEDEEGGGSSDKSLGLASFAAPMAIPQLPQTTMREVREKVVRITMDGNFSLGSGFVTKDIASLETLFPSELFDRRVDSACGGLYIVTAAHLFPSGFSFALHASLGEFHSEERAFNAGTAYDIALAGKASSRASAILVGKNEESDVALLRLNDTGIAYLLKAQGVQHCKELSGLTLASRLSSKQVVTAMGFATTEEERFLSKQGVVVEYPTEDTSNFGPIGKFKIIQERQPDRVFAENGMSGGPVINQDGKVVGISVEKPLANNSLIALDLTSIATTAGSAYFRNHSDDANCILRFNPFDRVLHLVNRDPNCDYGDFGSRTEMLPLPGTWLLQEILTLASEERVKSLGGYVLKNGHSIISGYTIVAGHQILRNPPLVVNRYNIERINASEVMGGFKIDPLSFHPLAPIGVRILVSPRGAQSGFLADESVQPIVVGVREGVSDHGFTPIYSLRDFTIWLRKQSELDRLVGKLCYRELGCREE